MYQVLSKLRLSLLYSQCLIQVIVSGSAVHQLLLVVCSSLKTGNLHLLGIYSVSMQFLLLQY